MLGWQTKPLGASQFWGAALWTVLLIGTIHMGLVECSRWQFAFILRCICPDDVGGRHHTWSSHPCGQPAKGSRSRMHFGECAGGRLPPGNTPFCFPRGPNYKANFFLWWFRCRRNSFLCGWCSGGWGPQLRGLFSQCDFHADSSWRSFTSTDILHSCAIEVSQKPSLFFFFFLARNDVLIFFENFFWEFRFYKDALPKNEMQSFSEVSPICAWVIFCFWRICGAPHADGQPAKRMGSPHPRRRAGCPGGVPLRHCVHLAACLPAGRPGPVPGLSLLTFSHRVDMRPHTWLY